MADLTTQYLGITLRSPLVASAGPLTGRLDSLAALAEAGAGAVVLPSLFEEEVDDEALRINAELADPVHTQVPGAPVFPSIEYGERGPQRHVKLAAAAKQELDIPVIASVNGTTPGGWVYYAQAMVDAGADAIELNLYSVSANRWRTATQVEEAYLAVVDQVRGAVDVPLAVKLSPYLSATAHFARRVVEAGADGLVLFNRFYQPDIDLDTLEVLPKVELSDSAELRLPLRWLAILRPQLPGTALAASTGVHSGRDAAKALLAGADVVMMTSALLRHGAGHLAVVSRDLRGYLDTHGYPGVGDLRGKLDYQHATDPVRYERANYLRTLASYRTHPVIG